MLAVMFQNAVDDDDAARFDAVCCIADGKPDLYDTASAFSFAVAEERATYICSLSSNVLPYLSPLASAFALYQGAVLLLRDITG
ncbi:hypothetical protein CYMTET_46285 [Cymbomonas tetramitiformis]|uniref:Uncharacterized protein n=1 Tax=Cymbomonas tetramitiformis TaxID=36881 RepID=A0AAE0EXR3_9CHLO|nr:hypothetical protein CYMTET_46285 [Cymbomonas tetramitiformis]